MTYVNKNGSQKHDNGRWEHNFSQSFIGTFQKCPEQARASYFHELPRTETDSTALGTAVHAGIEYALYEKRDERDPDFDDARDVLVNELDQIGEWKYTKLSRENVYATAAFLLHTWFKDVLPEVEPALIEHPFREFLYADEHREINVVGTMDCIDDDGRVWDWKTASRPYEKWEKDRWAVQPTVYSLAMCDAEMAPFRYCVLCYDGSVQIMDIHRDFTHVDWLREQCSQIAWMIENEVNPWPYNDSGWWCGPRWCGLFSECKGKFIKDAWTTS